MEKTIEITEDYVSFETAKLLKEKGFEGDTSCYYTQDSSKRWIYQHYHDFDKKDRIECPTLQMAMKWLREKHNIHIELTPICTGDSEKDLEWHYGWAVKTTIFIDRWKRYDAEHISYEKACESAIKYCLENLI